MSYLMCQLELFNAKISLTDEDEIEDDYDQYYDEGFCKTVSDSGSQLNKKCKLPFTFQRTQYSTCISGSKREKPWCPTKLDANGSYIRGKWGYCDTSLCPIGIKQHVLFLIKAKSTC